MPTQSRYVTLNNGVQMPILGFGVFQVPPDQTEQAVTDALAIGYRHLDTAQSYRNEQAVGRAIANSGIPRDQLFVTTKLWIQDGGEDGAKRAFEQSLQRLGLDYLDLYLIHQPFGDYYSSWRAMQNLYKQGVIKAIGVSNFYPDRLVDLIDHNEVTPAVNQVETHPFFQRQDYQQLMRERGVQPESWGPFAEGRNNLFSDPTLGQIGAGHGKSVAQVVLRWLIQREVAANPKSVRPERMAENLDVFDFQLTDEEMTHIAAMDTGLAVLRPPRPRDGQPDRQRPQNLIVPRRQRYLVAGDPPSSNPERPRTPSPVRLPPRCQGVAMTAWTNDELTSIGTADELELASARRDGTLGRPRTIWVVRVGDDLYVRSMYGRDGGWFPATQARHQGHIRAGGVDKDVTFADADHDLNDQIDAAYRDKYRRYGERIIGGVVNPGAQAATIKLMPR